MSLCGHLDSITSSGFAEGWAYDTKDPLRPLHLSVMRDGQEIASTLAHHYRTDLMEAGCGGGWCAFRARLSVPVKRALDTPLDLTDFKTGDIIHHQVKPRFLEDAVGDFTSVEQVVANDPTLLGPLVRLSGCNGVFNEFIKRRGVETFVRAAYVYILSRPADAEGINTYTRLIRQSMLEPFGLLSVLADSDEFRSRTRMLGAPNTPAFPFHLDS